MPTHIYLTKVSYIPQKNEIICYFENELKKEAKRFPFIPYIILKNNISKEKIEELLFSFKIKDFKICENKLFSSSFDNLKKISKIIAQLTNKKYLVLEPERIFLIEKGWSYFDSFDKDFNKTNSKSFEFFLFQNLNFEEALCKNPHSLRLVKQSVLSNILKVPIHNIPKKSEECVELLLENIYFKNGESISWNNEKLFYSAKEFAPYGEFETSSKIDFSPVWPQLLTKSFFNIGNTINCSCCKPIKLEDNNLLPISKLEVIVKDDFFYSSNFNTFAMEFHKNNSKKEIRKQKKYDFFLKQYPIGPLKKNESVLLPIEDVKKLFGEDKIKLGKNHSLSWFCKKQESFLSKEIILITKLIGKEKSKLIQTSLINKNFENNYFQQLVSSLNELLMLIPFQLTNSFSKFFSPNLAESIVAIQESTISKFNDFSEKAGYRVLFSNKNNVFVKGYSSLSLAQNFSKTTCLPQPIIASFAKRSSLKP
jgi:hypothetical protein